MCLLLQIWAEAFVAVGTKNTNQEEPFWVGKVLKVKNENNSVSVICVYWYQASTADDVYVPKYVSNFSDELTKKEKAMVWQDLFRDRHCQILFVNKAKEAIF